MNINFNSIIDDNVVCYLPFDPENMNKNYGKKSEYLEITPRQNILENLIPNSSFSECKSMTTSNMENNDFYKIKWNFDQTVFSIEFWFNFTKVGKKDDWFFRIYLEEYSINFYRHITSENTYYISMNDDEDSNSYNNNKILTENIWYHFCVERDLENKVIKFYINGELQGQEIYEGNDKINYILFYTGWGNDYLWKCNYINIIISDIIRYGSVYFTPPKSYIPSFRYSYINTDTSYCNLVKNTKNVLIIRNVIQKIQVLKNTERITYGKELTYKFDTSYKLINDTQNGFKFDTHFNSKINVISKAIITRKYVSYKTKQLVFIFDTKH